MSEAGQSSCAFSGQTIAASIAGKILAGLFIETMLPRDARLAGVFRRFGSNWTGWRRTPLAAAAAKPQANAKTCRDEPNRRGFGSIRKLKRAGQVAV